MGNINYKTQYTGRRGCRCKWTFMSVSRYWYGHTCRYIRHCILNV